MPKPFRYDLLPVFDEVNAANDETPNCHALKIYPEYFEAVKSGVKTFEIRKNDRAFRVGDYLLLKEYNKIEQYTGRMLVVRVTYITDFHQKEGYVVMGIKQ